MLYECFELFPITYPRAELKHALETTLTEDFLKQGVTTVYELSVTQAANGLYQELQTIQPGQKWDESFWIVPAGF